MNSGCACSREPQLGASDFSTTVYAYGPECDPFWSEMNGECSDAMGNYLTASTGPSARSQDRKSGSSFLFALLLVTAVVAVVKNRS